MTEPIGTVALLSLEPWDEVWRRNQHFAAELVRSGAVQRLVFVTPPRGGFAARSSRMSPMAGVEVITPPLLVPRRLGGHRVLARWLRQMVSGADVLWVNDPVAGRGVLGLGRPVVYDVTDDWRAMPQRHADRAAVVAAEDALARRARTVVCSDVLAERWHERYGIAADVVPNGVDAAAIATAEPVELDGHGPHAVYVGTLHTNRLDVDLVEAVAHDGAVTVHLVGPDHLDDALRARLLAVGVHIHGPVPAAEVARWLVAADVLICPHLADDFTMSLDAIKAHEYLATDVPVVATASCGFQSLTAPGLSVAGSAAFVSAVRAEVGTGPYERAAPVDWRERAAAFARVLDEVRR